MRDHVREKVNTGAASHRVNQQRIVSGCMYGNLHRYVGAT